VVTCKELAEGSGAPGAGFREDNSRAQQVHG
jgi:hypothetical protein